MTRYLIELLKNEDEWSAIIVDRVVVGRGKNAGDAVNAVVAEALETEKKFREAGLDCTKYDSTLHRSHSNFDDMQKHILRILVRFGLPVLIITIALIALYLAIRPDVVDQISFMRDRLLNDAHNVRIAIERIANKP